VPFVVMREGRAGQAMAVRFSPYPATIQQLGEAYVNMPVWIEIQLPDSLRHSLRYPVTAYPADFGGHSLRYGATEFFCGPPARGRRLPGRALGSAGRAWWAKVPWLAFPMSQTTRAAFRCISRIDWTRPAPTRCGISGTISVTPWRSTFWRALPGIAFGFGHFSAA